MLLKIYSVAYFNFKPLSTRRAFQIYLFFTLGIFLPRLTFAQFSTSGQVVDAVTLRPIPYATIALILQNNGVSADSLGVFSIMSRFDKDTLTISSVGYHDLKIGFTATSEDQNFKLIPTNARLLPVVITNPSKAYSTPSRRPCPNSFFYGQPQGSMGNFAQLIYLPESPSLLKSVTLCFAEAGATFRLRIYNVDSSNQPKEDLTLQSLVYKSKRGKNVLQLDSCFIILPPNECFIGIEWLPLPENEERIRFKTGNVTVTQLSYRPGVGYRDFKNEGGKNPRPQKLLFLGYDRRWRNFPFSQTKEFSISIEYRFLE